jgi:hypothetical protein
MRKVMVLEAEAALSHWVNRLRAFAAAAKKNVAGGPS